MMSFWYGWWLGCQFTPSPNQQVKTNTGAKNISEVNTSPELKTALDTRPPIPHTSYFSGIPKALLNKDVSNEVVTELQQRYGDSGWLIESGDNGLTIELDYASLFKNRPDLTLWTKYISKDSDTEKRIRSYVSYVQNLSYASPPMYRGDNMIAEYWTSSEVLENQSGDCDSLSMLLVSLVAVEKVESVLLYNSDNDIQHMVVGIPITPIDGELVTEINGQRYVVFDTTINHPPTKTQRVFFEEHTFNVIQLSL